MSSMTWSLGWVFRQSRGPRTLGLRGVSSWALLDVWRISSVGKREGESRIQDSWVRMTDILMKLGMGS